MILFIDAIAAFFWIAVIMKLDSHHKDKNSAVHTVKFFTFGLLSGVVAILIYKIVLLDTYETALTPFIVNMVFVGPIEELSKFIVFFLLVKKLKSIKEPRDGVLQAVTVGLAFGIGENLFYGLEYGVVVLAERSILTLLGHMSYAGIWGFYFTYIDYTGVRKDNGKYPMGC